MKKIGFIFPGQGAQHIGMGKEIIENYEVARKIFEQADQLLDFDLKALCFEENEAIHDTAYTQPALLAISIAVLKVIESYGIYPDYTAGLSLGEYSGLVASGVMAFDDAIKVVRKRGQLMQEAAKKAGGGMAAIVGSNEAAIKEIMAQVDGYMTVANYNSPKQIVVAGESEAMLASYPLFKEAGIRAIPLKVSGAFHSALMEEAGKGLEKVLNQIEVNQIKIPYLTNVTGEIVENSHQTKEFLVEQVKSSVYWEKCIRSMIREGVDLFVEIGAGKTLAGLLKKIDKKVQVISVSDQVSLEKLRELIKQREEN